MVHFLELTGDFFEPFIQHEHKIDRNKDREPEIFDEYYYTFHNH